jgi:hypothetical protein
MQKAGHEPDVMLHCRPDKAQRVRRYRTHVCRNRFFVRPTGYHILKKLTGPFFMWGWT